MAVVIGLANSFMASLERQEAAVQKRVVNALNKFQQNQEGSGLNLEKITNDFWSIRADQAYRIILHRKDTQFDYVFVWIDHHDDAYAWANSRRIEVTQDIIHLVELEVVESTDLDKGSLFNHVSDHGFSELNIPDAFYPIIRAMDSEGDLKKYKSFFHPLIYESLVYLSDASIPVSEIIAMQKEGLGSRDEEGLRKDQRAATRHRQTVVSLNDALHLKSLEESLDSPLSAWKLFLHSTQRDLASSDFDGPVKVLGGAGTGKTVVLVHRAKYLAEKSADKKILLTTYTKNLAEDIEAQVESICTAQELRNIEVKNIDHLVNHLFYKYLPHMKLIYNATELRSTWEYCISTAEQTNELPLSFYLDEWERVIVPQDIRTAQEYLKADRKGRGVPLNRKKKFELWEIFSAYKDYCLKNHVADVSLACQLVIHYLLDSDIEPMFSSILVDEIQDFDELKLKLLRLLAGPEHMNDLFLVGDSQQKIYRKEVVLKKCGIHVTPKRSFRLRINYRTTEEIRRWAYSLFDGEAVDDLDDGEYLDNRYISLLSGPEPIVSHFDSRRQEIEGIINAISDLEVKGAVEDPYDNVCLAFRLKKDLQMYKKELEDQGFRCYEIKNDSRHEFALPGIRMTTLHRIKGLEFDHVFICAVNDKIVPHDYVINQATDQVMKREVEKNERNLLYVAATRSRKTLYVFSHGQKSRFLV